MESGHSSKIQRLALKQHFASLAEAFARLEEKEIKRKKKGEKEVEQEQEFYG